MCLVVCSKRQGGGGGGRVGVQPYVITEHNVRRKGFHDFYNISETTERSILGDQGEIP